MAEQQQASSLLSINVHRGFMDICSGRDLIPNPSPSEERRAFIGGKTFYYHVA